MPGRGAGSTVRALLREPGAPLMILRRGATLGDEVYVAVEEPEAERSALALASTIARLVPNLAPPALARLLRREPCGLLVLSRELVLRTEGEGIALLVDILRCPVLVTT